ncbi:MAG TPA: patatin-like phospholipase family protein [Thermoanaerobaculia bacterium]
MDAAIPFPPHANPSGGGELAVMLTGGGARAAYQAGLLKGIAKHFPHVRFRIVTGVSAGAINAAFLAARRGTLAEQAHELARLWSSLECSNIYRFDWTKLVPFRSALATLYPRKKWHHPRGVVDTTPLRDLLSRVLGCRHDEPIPGIIDNLRRGDLHALALMTLDYSSGQSVRWVQGRNFDVFEGPNHRGELKELTVEHILASSALPFIFPAVSIGSAWHGDGGIRLAAPLSPAVHLGATRILAMSTGYQRTPDEASAPVVCGYPPAAQVLGQLVNAVFLDNIDEDVVRMERLNEMLRKLPEEQRSGLRPIELAVLRPSVDLGKLAGEYQQYLPKNLKLLIRALGTDETDSPDFVSLLMFETHYTTRLIEIGEQDVEARLDDLRIFFGEAKKEELEAMAAG